VPLKGAPAPERVLPVLQLATGHRKIVFHWNYQENTIMANGDGAIRVASPDSARVDLFLNGGLFLGNATMIGDNLSAPNKAQVEKVLPPAPMMWAVLGRPQRAEQGSGRKSASSCADDVGCTRSTGNSGPAGHRYYCRWRDFIR
jgi:hypothetical protein